MSNDTPLPRRILIIRLSALGDVVMSSGLIPALRKLYPQAELSWLTEPPAEPLLRHNQHLHEVLVWPRATWQAHWRARQWRALWRDILAFRKSLRQRRFDLVIDAHGLLKSGVCAWLTGSPRRIGLIAREGSHLLVHERVTPTPDPGNGISSEYRFLAQHLGAPAQAFQLELAVGEAPRARARLILEQAGVRGPFAVLCPFTTRPQKHWFEDRWSAMAEALHAQGIHPVLAGGPADSEAAQRIAAAAQHLVNLAGRLKLDETVALIADSHLLVGVDTGLTHMGTALRIPTVALFGSTRPYLRTPSDKTVVMYDGLACSPCRRHPTCGGEFNCMRQFTVERVLAQAMAQYNKGLEASQP